MAKMMHDEFEEWIRNSCSGCMEQQEIDEYFQGDLDFDTGEYSFRDDAVQAQWEAWRTAQGRNPIGLTAKEKEILDHTVAIWHGVTRDLQDTPADEVDDIARAIHAIQATMAMRVARRADPDYWRKP